jgi:DNA-binding NtrC family response regulator
MRQLFDYPWVGNVRELENTIEHSVVLSKGGQIEVSHLTSIFFCDTDTAAPAPAVSHGTIFVMKKCFSKKYWRNAIGTKAGQLCV